ncbi:PAS domain S-box protein [bacterium]|nr:PAS domain S-box protein [bacterium]
MESKQVTMLEEIPFGCVFLSVEGTVSYANRIMLNLLGLKSESDLRNRPLVEFLTDEQQASFSTYINGLREGDSAGTWQSFSLVNPVNERVHVLVNGRLDGEIVDEHDSIALYFFKRDPLQKPFDRDTESRRRTFGDNKYQVIFESATIGIAVFEEDGTIDEVNKTFESYFDLKRDDILGRPCCDVFNQPEFEKVQRVMDAICDGTETFERNVVTLNKHKGGHRILEFSLAKVFNRSLNLNMLMMIVEDITNQRDTQKALIQSEKLALTGRLAASLAHEINNPLQTSIGCLGLAEEMLEEDDRDLGVYVQMAIEELRRSARIVKKLRDLNRTPDETEKTQVDLQEMLNGVLILTRKRLHDRNIVPVFPYQGEKPLVMASEDQLQQVFLNLIMNASDALEKGGNIYLDIIPKTDPEGMIVKVRDTGIGIQPEHLDNIFDPFFTTKKDGLGLGLFTSKRIIENHDGWLDVESEPGVGTEFTIWLPGQAPTNEEE